MQRAVYIYYCRCQIRRSSELAEADKNRLEESDMRMRRSGVGFPLGIERAARRASVVEATSRPAVGHGCSDSPSPKETLEGSAGGALSRGAEEFGRSNATIPSS